MWTLNGGKTLPAVLGIINEAIPANLVNQKMVIDDGSKDNSVNIARKYSWKAIKNEAKEARSPIYERVNRSELPIDVSLFVFNLMVRDFQN
jgi:glycosyltransferase involved in cell wall biosynthesis